MLGPLKRHFDAVSLAKSLGARGLAWAVVEDGFGPPMVCAEDSTEALAGDRTSTMHFAVTLRQGVRAMATATVLDFGTTPYASGAPEAFSTAADWLESCDDPVDREHRVFSAGDASGEMHNSQSASGARAGDFSEYRARNEPGAAGVVEVKEPPDHLARAVKAGDGLQVHVHHLSGLAVHAQSAERESDTAGGHVSVERRRVAPHMRAVRIGCTEARHKLCRGRGG